MIYAIGAFIFLIIFFAWCRKPGKGGEWGRRLRISEWQCWKDEVERQEHWLDELKKHEPKY